MQEDSTTLAALPLFKAQADARHSEAGNAGIEPGMAVLMTRVDADAALLSRHAAHLRSHLDVSSLQMQIPSVMCALPSSTRRQSRGSVMQLGWHAAYGSIISQALTLRLNSHCSCLCLLVVPEPFTHVTATVVHARSRCSPGGCTNCHA